MRPRHSTICALLLIGCSFVRDVDQHSEGSGALSDGGTDCKAGGAVCGTASECCSGTCEGTCQCGKEGDGCTKPQDCCSNRCSSTGQCGACGDVGSVCGGASDPSCCPGRECVPDGTGSGSKCQVTNACTNASDASKIAAAGSMYQKLTDCDSLCTGLAGEQARQCYISCLSSTTGAVAVSSDCASCYAYWWLGCLDQQCISVNCKPTYSAECTACCNSVCLATFEQCSGRTECPEP